MNQLRLGVPVFLAGLLLGAFILGDGARNSTAQAPSAPRGMLPQQWRKLGLSQAQIAQIYAAQSMYRQKVKDLEAQIDQIKKEERAELLKILTPEQKDKLVEILLGGSIKDDVKASPKDDSKGSPKADKSVPKTDSP